MKKRFEQIEARVERLESLQPAGEAGGGGDLFDFINGWKPFSEFRYEDFVGKQFWAWCEFVTGSEARQSRASLVHGGVDDHYITAPVRIIYRGVIQNAVAWCEEKPVGSPYRNSDRALAWRQFMLGGDHRVRTVRLKRRE